MGEAEMTEIAKSFLTLRENFAKMDELIATKAPALAGLGRKAVGCNAGEIRCGGGSARKTLEELANPVINPVV